VRPDRDRRIVLVELTDAAQPVIDACLTEVSALHAAEFAIFTADEREQLINLLARFAAHLTTLDLDSITAAAKPRRALHEATRRLRKGAPHD
jgi:hypothetical protein